LADIADRHAVRSWLPLLVLALVSLAVFCRALGHDFLINWDDRQYVLDNAVIRGFSLDHLKTAFTTFYIGNYAPLHLISYMFDYQLWGLKASGFILTNILLHTMNGMLFYHLLRRIAGERVWIFAAALIFLLHPLQVESVAWVSQRKNLLARTIFLMAIYLYREYRGDEQKRPALFYLLSLAAFILALLAKSVVVILPLVLILFDICLLNRRDLKGLFMDKVPFIAISAIFCLVAVESQSMQFQGGRTSWHGGTPYATFLTMLPVLAYYLRMLAWPANLSAFYDIPIRMAVDGQVAMAALLSLILMVTGVLLYWRRRLLFFWYALFFIGLIPVSQIVPIVTLMNDRYLYFPMLGAASFMGMVAFGDKVWSELSTSPKFLALPVIFLLLTLSLAVASFQRVGVWRDSATLWGDAVRKAPNLALTHDSYGEGLLQQGKIDEAVGQFMIALSLAKARDGMKEDAGERNARANTHNNLGTAYGMKGMTDAAIEQFTAAIRLNPGFAKAYYNLGNGLMNKGMFADALRCFETAVRLEPANPVLMTQLMKTRELLGQTGY
jgi:tetratricopeptide (TPR) repeat protein